MFEPEERSILDSPVLASLVARMSDERWALSTNSGWDAIIAEADARLAKLDPDYRVVQIKEKFGGLRFYYSPSTKDPEIRAAMESVVREAEAKAARTCEFSGRDDGVLGTWKGRRWFHTASVSLYGPEGFEPYKRDE